jgi:nucleoside-diphosphate-sugar epimerase
MRLLVLGGTRFVGRAIVAEALDRGHEVTVVSRGVSGRPPDAVTWRSLDRTDRGALEPVTAEGWDGVIDTWNGDAAAVELSAALLVATTPWYGYVSSRSVYRWPMAVGSDESAPVVDPAVDEGYAADKRGGELAVLEHFAGRCVLGRAGLILGPYEDVGRLTWWLQRAAAGGSMVAPAPPHQVWQLIDARDLATFMLDAAAAGTSGVFNLVCPRSDGVTTARILDSCAAVTGGRAELKWIEPAILARAGVQEWDGLPGWLAPDSEAAGLHDCDVSAALAHGLSCRPVEATVKDTWAWLSTLPPRERAAVGSGISRKGLTAEQEQAIWWLAG